MTEYPVRITPAQKNVRITRTCTTDMQHFIYKTAASANYARRHSVLFDFVWSIGYSLIPFGYSRRSPP